MFKTQAEMEAVPLTAPEMRTVLNPVTLNEDEHLGYTAEIQYKRKPPATRLILCSRLDTTVEKGATAGQSSFTTCGLI